MPVCIGVCAPCVVAFGQLQLNWVVGRDDLFIHGDSLSLFSIKEEPIFFKYGKCENSISSEITWAPLLELGTAGWGWHHGVDVHASSQRSIDFL